MASELAKSIGHAARAARVGLGLTQAEAAESIGISNEFYARIERGQTMPSVPTLARMSAALKVSADHLFGRARPEERHAVAKGRRLATSRPEGESDSPELRRVIRRLRNAHHKTVHLVALVTSALDKKSTSRRTPRIE